MAQMFALETATPQDRTRRLDGRRWAERLLDTAAHLPAAERLTLEQVYHHGLTATDLARLSGENPRAVRARVNRLVRRVRTPMFRFVAHHGEFLPPATRRIARLIVLRGLSLRDTAALTGLSLHHVRMHMQTTVTLCELTTGKAR